MVSSGMQWCNAMIYCMIRDESSFKVLPVSVGVPPNRYGSWKVPEMALSEQPIEIEAHA